MRGLVDAELDAWPAGERYDLAPVGPPAAPVRRGPTLVPADGVTVRAHPR